jgi:transposase
VQEVIPIMKKRMYRKVAVKDINVEALLEQLQGGRAIFAIDVAKVDMVAAIADGAGEVLVTVAWKQPSEMPEVLQLLRVLQEAGVELEAVMESSGVYGDVLRYQLERCGVAVYRIGSKRTHDAAEVFDGVPSLHDAKSASIIAQLHAKRISSRWNPLSKNERRVRAALDAMDLYRDHHARLIRKLDSLLGRHWPELTEILELTSASLAALLARVGGPADVAREPDEAAKLIRGISHRLIKEDKIEAVLASARSTVGVELIDEERVTLMALAQEVHRTLKAFKKGQRKVEDLSANDAVTQALALAVGKVTAAVLVADVGDPTAFPSAGAYLKAFGINLKEKSSGKHKGRLKLTKRGPGRARQYLWLAVGRWVQKDPIARAWRDKKIARDGGGKARGFIALMRKLAKALFHVARGESLQSDKLFDVTRLRLA